MSILKVSVSKQQGWEPSLVGAGRGELDVGASWGAKAGIKPLPTSSEGVQAEKELGLGF